MKPEIATSLWDSSVYVTTKPLTVVSQCKLVLLSCKNVLFFFFFRRMSTSANMTKACTLTLRIWQMNSLTAVLNSETQYLMIAWKWFAKKCMGSSLNNTTSVTMNDFILDKNYNSKSYRFLGYISWLVSPRRVYTVRCTLQSSCTWAFSSRDTVLPSAMSLFTR